jgi:transcriptional regulator with XRE-family HTH domain
MLDLGISPTLGGKDFPKAAIFPSMAKDRPKRGRRSGKPIRDRGHRVRLVREELDVTETELARRCGWGHRKQSKIEQGDTGLQVEDLDKIAYALGVPVADLFSSRPRTPAEVQQLVEIYLASSPEERRRLMDIARVLHQRPAAE